MTTISDLLDTLGSLFVVGAPASPDARVDDVVVYDSADAASVRPGSILLAVSVPPDDEAGAVSLIDCAAHAGAVAVAFRSDHESIPRRVADHAVKQGVGLLLVPAEMRWERLIRLVNVALAPPPTPAGGFEDLFDLAEAIVVTVGASVTIEDPRWRVLAYANAEEEPIDEVRRQAILGRLPPSGWGDRLDAANVLSTLRSSDRPFRLELSGTAPRLVAPVRAGSELLGSIWLAEGSKPLGEDAAAALERFASVATTHMVGIRAAQDIRQRTRAAFVRELLDGRVVADSDLAEPFLRTPGPFSVVVFAPATSASWPADPSHLRSITSLYAEELQREASCALIGRCVWAILPTPARTPREMLLRFAERVIDHAHRTIGVHLHAAVGTSVPSAEDIPASKTSAERALWALSSHNGDTAGAAYADDMWTETAILDIIDVIRDMPDLASGRLTSLAASDPKQVASLRAWLDAHGDMRQAAALSGVHVNTMRYRVHRIEQMCDLDLADPEQRLLLNLVLRVMSADDKECRRKSEET